MRRFKVPGVTDAAPEETRDALNRADMPTRGSGNVVCRRLPTLKTRRRLSPDLFRGSDKATDGTTFHVAFDEAWQTDFESLADAVEWARVVSGTGRMTWVVERREEGLTRDRCRLSGYLPGGAPRRSGKGLASVQDFSPASITWRLVDMRGDCPACAPPRRRRSPRRVRAASAASRGEQARNRSRQDRSRDSRRRYYGPRFLLGWVGR